MPSARAPLPLRPPLPEAGREEALPASLPDLQALAAETEREIGLWDDYVRKLLAMEQPAQGVCHAAELHEAKQYRMALRYKLDVLQARLRRWQSA